MSTVVLKVLSKDAYPKKFDSALQVITDQDNLMEMFLPKDLATKFEQGFFYKIMGCNSFVLTTTNKNALKVTHKSRVCK